MNFYVPIYNNMQYVEKMVISRALPAPGDLVVKKGDTVLPFTKIGRTKISHRSYVLDPKTKINPTKLKDPIVFEGEQIGRLGLRPVTSPFLGMLEQTDVGYTIKEEKKDFWLLSGVWGVVDKVVQGQSATIKTQAMDVNFVACTKEDVLNELVVFPNPSELLDLEYLKSFARSVAGKVVYVGDYIRSEVVEKAIDQKVGALIGGSVDKKVFNFAKANRLPLGITTGFGNLKTHPDVFEFLKGVTNRHVFFSGKAGHLRIPVPAENNYTVKNLRVSIVPLSIGLKVLVLEKDAFCQFGVVDHLQDETIYVKLNQSEDVIEVKMPNILALT